MDSREAQSDNSPDPISFCKNGNCGAVPPSLPIESVRMTRLEASHFCAGFVFVNQFFDGLVTLDELSPSQPSLDLPDPPPRTS